MTTAVDTRPRPTAATVKALPAAQGKCPWCGGRLKEWQTGWVLCPDLDCRRNTDDWQDDYGESAQKTQKTFW